MGADIVFIEAPKNIEEMKIICKEIPAKKIINLLEGGITPILPLHSIEELGFNIAFHPLTLLAASMSSMKNVLELLKKINQQMIICLTLMKLRKPLVLISIIRQYLNIIL